MIGQHPINRRKFLLTTGGTAAGAAAVGLMPARALAQAKPLPAYADWKKPDAMIVHTAQTLETTRAGMGSPAITPADILYVRNNLPAPSADITADPDAWEIAFEGVGEPGTMSLGDLKTYGVESIACVLQCSGNGRAFFDHETSGTQWSVGAAGNVFWTGVPLRRVVAAMGGPSASARFLTGTGGETLPEGLDPTTIIVERSVPTSALDVALIAFELNGEPLPVAHGGPARLVVPGYYGVNNVKYIKKIAFTEEESPAKIQQSGYRMRPVGESGAPGQPSMYEMSVKSWVTAPLMDVSSGRVVIQGVAMGGVSAVSGVDVSLDGGGSWKAAEFTGPDLGAYAWRPFELVTDLSVGTHVVASRATNAAGDSQPENFPPNHRGYGNNGWKAHAIELTVS
ncbi:SorT family sulfite dehydrogenase catalytic subunit [Acuticoccus mangrovi]|uniref:Sulfite oxidase n=1 Tax=Acuticoccus mangrovi TaxID=2796142 RepID=A0A934IPB6_9HYPH|nr:sulfite oxidase [Acuticoccus mangrovi]MBJ3778576.1 sulfite oxidase [Acuticoccus mangrovi]